MDQVGRKAMQKNRKDQVLERVLIRAPIQGRSEVLRQPGQRARIGRRADQSVLIAVVEHTQRMHEAADVCPNAEVADAARVDDDVTLHPETSTYLYRRGSPRSSNGGQLPLIQRKACGQPGHSL